MKTKLMCLLSIVVIVVACGRSGARRDQPQYETVDEGSASGVTSTIHGPGETLPPITGTSTDHTTAFAFDPNAPPSTSTATMTTQPPGTIVGTLPPLTPVSPQPVPQQPRPPQPRPVSPPPPPPTETEPEPPPPPPTDTTETEPPPTDTAEEEPEPEPPPPPTNTDTSATTTQPPPPPPPMP